MVALDAATASGRHTRFRALALVAAVLAACTGVAQSPGGEHTFRVFRRGAPIGMATATVTRTAEGWTITGGGRLDAEYQLTVRQFDARYDAAWRPVFMTTELAAGGASRIVHVAIAGSTTRTDIVTGGEARWRSFSISPDTIFLPEFVFAAYEAVAARLASTPPPRELPFLLAPEGERRVLVDAPVPTPVRTREGVVSASRFTLTLVTVKPTPIHVWVHRGRLLRLDLPLDEMSVIRSDVLETP